MEVRIFSAALKKTRTFGASAVGPFFGNSINGRSVATLNSRWFGVDPPDQMSDWKRPFRYHTVAAKSARPASTAARIFSNSNTDGQVRANVCFGALILTGANRDGVAIRRALWPGFQHYGIVFWSTKVTPREPEALAILVNLKTLQIAMGADLIGSFKSAEMVAREV